MKFVKLDAQHCERTYFILKNCKVVSATKNRCYMKFVKLDAQHCERTYFILKNCKVVSATKAEWEEWFKDVNNRIVDITDISKERFYYGGHVISTIFAGDHFQTMIFGGDYNHYCWTCSSFGKSKLLHWEIVDNIRQGLEPCPQNGKRVTNVH